MARRQEHAERGSVAELVPLNCVFDPRPHYESLKEQLHEHHRNISALRVLIGHHEEAASTVTKLVVLEARHYAIPVLTRAESTSGIIPRGMIPFYMDLCVEAGITGIQFRKEKLPPNISPRELVSLGDQRNIDILFELDESFVTYPVGNPVVRTIVDQATAWLDAGAVNIVADTANRTVANNVVLSSDSASGPHTDLLTKMFGMHAVMFKARTEPLQRAILEFLGEEAHVCDVSTDGIVRLEQIRASVYHPQL